MHVVVAVWTGWKMVFTFLCTVLLATRLSGRSICIDVVRFGHGRE